ncbi:MAG: Uma2 family endonuclease [Cyanobacteria bacterium P01_D01_bin.6]
MTYTPTQTLSFEDFVTQYGDDPRYELIDGELRALEPTGPHESVAGKLAGHIYAEILRQSLTWTVPKNCLIQPPATAATALRPDVIVLDEAALKAEPLWQREPIITSGAPIRLVVEVVSTNWQDDYARKLEEYALLQIAEYWIVDFAGLGGTAFIGRPKQPTFTICQLQGDEYHRTLHRLAESIHSHVLPELSLQLENVI